MTAPKTSPAPRIKKPHARGYRFLRGFFVSLLFLVLVIACLLYWLLSTNSGLQQLARLSESFAAREGMVLQIQGIGGRASESLRIERLFWQQRSPEGLREVEISDLQLDWQLADLMKSQLTIERLHIGLLTLNLPESNASPVLPESLILPLPIRVADFSLREFSFGKHPDISLPKFWISNITGALESQGDRHHLSKLFARFGKVQLQGNATIHGNAPFDLMANLSIQGQTDRIGEIAEQPLDLQIQAGGNLAHLRIDATSAGKLSGNAKILLNPFSAIPVENLSLDFSGINPADWHEKAPKAQISLQMKAKPEDAAFQQVSGDFILKNTRPDVIDKQGVPIAALRGVFLWAKDRLRLDTLLIDLMRDPKKPMSANQGKIWGRGTIGKESTNLDLTLKNIDLAQISPQLPMSTLNGKINATGNNTRQELRFDIADNQFTLKGEATQEDQRIEIKSFSLQARNSQLSGKARVSLKDSQDFSFDTELRHFQPSRFFHHPALDNALLNAKIAATGSLKTPFKIKTQIEFLESNLSGLPLVGTGRAEVAWPAIHELDLNLSLGKNTLKAGGKLGEKDGDLRLKFAIKEAKRLGIEGESQGEITITNGYHQPRLQAVLESAELVLPDQARLKNMKLNLQAGGTLDDPLRLDLTIGQIDTPSNTRFLREVNLNIDGTHRAHRLDAKAKLRRRQEVDFALEGHLEKPFSLNALPAWQGEIQSFRFLHPREGGYQLTRAGALQFNALGWKIGTLALSTVAGEQPLLAPFTATLEAGTAKQQLAVRAEILGKTNGKITARLDAGMATLFSLRQNAPWQGELLIDSDHLNWLGPLIDDNLKSEGQVKARIHLNGTPEKPSLEGQVEGDALSLAHDDLALKLYNGTLRLSLDKDALTMQQLEFSSRLTPPPQQLLSARTDSETTLAALTAKPGRITASGRLLLGEKEGNTQITVQLDRLGVSQQPDQWLLLSGNAALVQDEKTLGIEGKLTLDAGYWQLKNIGVPSLSDDVVVRQINDGFVSDSPLRRLLNLDLQIDMGRQFLFSGQGLSARLAGNLRLRAAGRDLPRAEGRIRIQDGQFAAYGQKLKLTRGTLQFNGLIDNPSLDVRAMRQGQAVEAGVEISGNVDAPRIKLVSEPNVPDAEKLSWLVLGHGSEHISLGDASLLLSAADGLLGNESGSLVQQVGKGLGLDEFGIKQGAAIGEEGNTQISSKIVGSTTDRTATAGKQILTVGKRLNANTLLRYEQTLGEAESLLLLSYQINKSISLVSRIGTDNAIDIFYTWIFGRTERETANLKKGNTDDDSN